MRLRPPLENPVFIKSQTILILVILGILFHVSSPVLSQPPSPDEEIFPDPSEYLGSVKVHIQEAIELATKRFPGIVILAELEPSPEETMWEIEIVTPSGEVKEVFVHAITGKLSLPEDVEDE